MVPRTIGSKMNAKQMELSLSTKAPGQVRRPKRARHSHAAWWFNRMRQLVDSATDWPPLSSTGLLAPLSKRHASSLT
jgi:hypothetical protein